MKQVIERLIKKENKTDGFHFSTSLYMILLFLTFWGVSFYVLVNSFA
ncbi:hypothetical protein HRG84_15225 [Flavisolibacter sp. BT320]|nr:hypothetical protein [Flavisolibacter longurius]